MSAIQAYFEGKTVLVTGATGFLGKALVEKMLRSLPGLRRLYLLIRPKERGTRSVPAAQRFRDELVKSDVFDRLRAELGDRFEDYVAEKVAVVGGELTEERLGASDEDYRRLTEEVEVIINSAAVVVFDERVDLSLDLNTLGARRMMDFARQCRQLQAVVHISTCYVSGKANGWRAEAVEPLPFDVNAEIAKLEKDIAELKQKYPGDVEALKKELVKLGLDRARSLGWHDTYTFTKALGEQLVVQHRGELPTVILRPSIIESTFREPGPGWIDGFRMTDPLFVGYGKGYLKDFPGKPDTIADLIPCDHVVNATLACVPRCAAEGGLTVYQVASGDQNPIHSRTVFDIAKDYFRRNPLTDRDGRPIPTSDWTWPDAASYRRNLVWRYGVPLSIGRALLRPLSFLRPVEKLRRKLAVKRASLDLLLYYVDIYSPYSAIESRYSTANTTKLWNSLSAEDHALFPFDVRGLDWQDYIGNVHIPGLKRHVLNLEVEEREDGQGVAVPTIPDLLARSADRFPQRIALQMKRNGQWVRYTYDDVERLVGEASANLAKLGITKGDAVLLYSENQPEWGIAYLAAVSLGAAVVPTDRQLGEEDVLAVAEFVGARAILVSPAAYAHFSEETRHHLEAPLFLNINAGCQPFDPTRAPAAAVPHRPAPVRSDDLASILVTTGVNGPDPRAVMLTHHNFLANVMGVVQMLPPRPTDNFLSILPLHHALEFTGGFLVPLFTGATVTYCDSMKSRVVLETMREAKATCLIGVPRVFQILHDTIRREVAHRGRKGRLWFDTLKGISKAICTATGRNPGRWLFACVHEQLGGQMRAFISGGAALSPQIHEEFTAMGFELCEGYGLTEIAPIATANPLRGARKGSVGLPLPGVEVKINNPDERGVGEILVRGPNLTAGYFHNPKATGAAIRDGWLHTGDVGYRDRDGYLYLTGRIKDLIVTAAGKNVYPDEVERRYAGLPGVRELCVIGWEDTVLGETVHAVVVPDPAAVPATESIEETVREAVRQRSRSVPSHQRLQRIHFTTGELPKLPTGAFDRARVKQQLYARLLAAHPGGVIVSDDGSDGSELLLDPLPHAPLHGPRSRRRAGGVSPRSGGVAVAEPEAEVSPAWGRVLGERTAVDERWFHPGGAKRAARALTRALMGIYARLWHSFEVRGREHLPQGAFIVAASHCSHLDTGAVVVAMGDRGSELFIMGARDYFFNHPSKGWFFHTFLNVVPFERTENMIKGLRVARSILQAGRPVLIFPEGTRSLNGELQPFKPGIGLLGVELGVPIVPCLIEGTFTALPKGKYLPRRTKIRVSFAPAIHMEDYRARHADCERRDLYRQVADDVRAAVAGLLPQGGAG